MALNANLSLGAILNTATSGLQANQAALRTTSNNIANINTEGYHRRVVDFAPRLTADRLTGVTVDDIRRISNEFLARESVDAAGAVGKMETLSSYFSRMQDLVGSLDGGSSLEARVSGAMSSLQQLSVDPSSAARRNSALSAVTSALTAISSMATNVQSLRQDANTQISSDISKVNTLISQIYNMNKDIKAAYAGGDTQTGLTDQRDRAVAALGKYVDIRTYEQSDGRLYVSLSDGTGLVSDVSSELRYSGPTAVSTTTSFPQISLQRLNPEGGSDIGPAIALEPHLRGGEMRGLIDMRDRHLPDLAEQLGSVSAALAQELNAVHNNSSSVPPPASLTGVNTGLLAGDALNFTGSVTVAVVDSQGKLVQSADIDTSTLLTVNDLVTAINSALSGTASASFNNGVLSLTANNPGQGVAMLQSPSNPSDRAGRGVAQFFGLNNLVSAASPSSFATGMVGTDWHNFTAGGSADFVLRGTDGSILKSFNMTVAGTTVNDLLTSLNAGASGYATFALDSKGTMVMTPAAAYSGARLEVKNDTTARGATGVSMTQFYGLGTSMRQNQAMSLSVRTDIMRNPASLALAQLDISAASVPGDVVLGISDNTGAQGLASAANKLHGFDPAGGLSSSTMSINDYVSQIMGAQADLTNAAEDERVNRVNVLEEVQARRNSVEGVNLDEELSNMMIYQQAYNASARIMTVVQQMYDTLLQVI